MHRLKRFLKRVYVLLIFLVLAGLAIHYYANSSPYTRARLLTASNRGVGWFYRQTGGVGHFFRLGKANRALGERVAELENELAAYRQYFTEAELDSVAASISSPFKYVAARVVRNSVNRAENYIVLDKGRRHGVVEGMAVVSPDGFMAGYVESVSERSAVCVSALSRSFRASGKIARTGDFGSISWPGRDVRHLLLSEVPKYAEVMPGDTIVTTSYSLHFPEGISIGTVSRYEIDEATASYNIDVKMGIDIWKIRDVILILNEDARQRFGVEEVPTEDREER